MNKLHSMVYIGALVPLSLCTQVAAANLIAINDAQQLMQHQLNTRQFSASLPLTGIFAVDNVILPNGELKVQHRQFYQGIPVQQGWVVASEMQGYVDRAYGQFVADLEQDLTSIIPNITHDGALQIAFAHLGLIAPKKEIPENQHITLYIWLDAKQSARLVYEVSFFLAREKPTRPHFLIDAQTGEIVKQWEGLAHAVTFGSGPGGNLKTGQYGYGTTYPGFLITKNGTTCTMDVPAIKTVNLNNATTGDTAFSYNCADEQNYNAYREVNGAYSPLNDAQFFANQTLSMYQEWLGIAPLPFQLVMRVHYGENFGNAFWNGSNMSFGDGNGRYYPLLDINIAAHEISHGFTNQYSNLIYSGMSGGINESFSDIAAEAAEFYWKGDVDWQIGREIVKGSGSLRYFALPSQDGKSIDNASEYMPGMQVHYSSGVFNRAFYLLANSDGWNIPNAFKAFAYANRLYWQPNSNFNQAACGVKLAAQDLGLPTSPVIDAFSDVGVYPCLTLTSLLPAAPLTLSLSPDAPQYFNFSLPINISAASVSLSGGQGSADLLIKYGQIPTATRYDCQALHTAANQSCVIAAPEQGEYFALVSPQTQVMNASLSLAIERSAIESLVIGSDLTDISGAQGAQLFYQFEMPAGISTVQIQLAGGAGDVDLYVRRGEFPNLTEFDCRPFAAGNSERCALLGQEGEIFYIMLQGYRAFSGVSLAVYDQGQLTPELQALPINAGDTFGPLQGEVGNSQYFNLTITPEQSGQLATGTAAIRLSGGSGNADLYIEARQVPTITQYTCYSTSVTNEELCELNQPLPGDYFILVFGAQNYNDVNLSVSSISSNAIVSYNSGGAVDFVFLLLFLGLFLDQIKIFNYLSNKFISKVSTQAKNVAIKRSKNIIS